MSSEEYQAMNASSRAYKKGLRTRANNEFTREYLPILQEMYTTYYTEYNNKYTFDTYKFGLVDYYPKSKTLYVRRWNKYFEYGLGFIKKHMI